ncbi:MAG: D-alanyl-D-alanine carboxypeptidase/D-alanyl-D-alanine-endopeptidase [Planctomycetota bacterium]
MRTRLGVLVGALLAACTFPFAVGAADAESRELTARLLTLGSARKLEPAQLAFSIVGPDGTVIAEHRSEEPEPPASNVKLLTAVAALDLLGPDFEVSTELWRTGLVRNGVLEGDLIVRGRGDPSISGRFHRGDIFGPLRPWVAVLGELGIERVSGRLLCDDRYFSGPSVHADWPSEQLDRWYCAPSGALNLNDNCVDVHIAPRVGAQEVRVWLEPSCARFEIVNQLRSVVQRKQHVYSVERATGSWRIDLRGGFLASGTERTEWVAVPDPTDWFGCALQTFLESEGIGFGGGVGRLEDAAAVADAVLVASTQASVASMLPSMLKRSLNLYADCLLRIVGKERGAGGSFEQGADCVRSHLVRLGIAREGVVVRDGSGLSAKNRASAATLVRALRHARATPWFPVLRDALAVAGADGTLRSRFASSPVAGKVLAKTGHIDGVSTLAGYLTTGGGDVTFAFLFRGPVARTAAARNWQEEAIEIVWRALEGAR